MACAAIALPVTVKSSPRALVTAALEDPAIIEAIRRGVRKARVKRYAAVMHLGPILLNGSRRNEVRDYVSDFEQTTYLKLLEEYADEFAALSPEQRPIFVETLAKRIAWREVYRIKHELPLAELLDGESSENNSAQRFACDDISLGQRNRHPSWLSASASECELIDFIDRQTSETVPEEQPETRYERTCRLLGPTIADWMLDYENRRRESAKTSAERVRYHRLRKKLESM
jgi:hypothetical protein